MKFGKFYNEFNGMQTKDYFSFWINDFPIVVVRRYMNCHSKDNETSYYVGFLGFTWRINKGEINGK
jgi:hypothetical protein